MPDGVTPGKFSLLGLGDIVLPGLFVALLLRFDASLEDEKRRINGTQPSEHYAFRKPFFTANLVAYALGLSVVLWLVYSMNMGQVCRTVSFSKIINNK